MDAKTIYLLLWENSFNECTALKCTRLFIQNHQSCCTYIHSMRYRIVLLVINIKTLLLTPIVLYNRSFNWEPATAKDEIYPVITVKILNSNKQKIPQNSPYNTWPHLFFLLDQSNTPASIFTGKRRKKIFRPALTHSKVRYIPWYM